MADKLKTGLPKQTMGVSLHYMLFKIMLKVMFGCFKHKGIRTLTSVMLMFPNNSLPAPSTATEDTP
jgi:hypothetical protein